MSTADYLARGIRPRTAKLPLYVDQALPSHEATSSWTKEYPPPIAITINIQASKPSVLLIAAAWVIAMSIAITAFAIIVEKTIIWTTPSTEEVKLKPPVTVRTKTLMPSNRLVS